jgi:transcriptional regulator with XRE-family HTH domain
MFQERQPTLAEYVRELMEERRFSSERAFALHVGISPRTLGRILDGEKVDPESLQKIAAVLNLPVENLYRLAGYLPPEEARTQLLREIEHLLRRLPEDTQRRILDMVRVEHRHYRGGQERAEEEEANRAQRTG